MIAFRYLLILIVLSISVHSREVTKKTKFTLESPEGKTIQASLIEVTKNKIKLEYQGRVLNSSWDKFSDKHYSLFEDFEKYQNKPFDINQLKKPDSDVIAGKVLEVTLDELEKDAQDRAAGYTVRIPDNYHPWKETPLFVWFAGWRGGRNVSSCFPLVDKEEFLIVCLPYPHSEPRPLLAVKSKRGSERLWPYHKAMLDDLKQKIPNISTTKTFVGGFSNGAHAVGMYLGENIREFVDYFNGYVLVEGGASTRYDYEKLQNKHVYYSWGSESGEESRSLKRCEKLRTAEATVYRFPMQSVGHEFPANEKKTCHSWINDIILKLSENN